MVCSTKKPTREEVSASLQNDHPTSGRSCCTGHTLINFLSLSGIRRMPRR